MDTGSEQDLLQPVEATLAQQTLITADGYHSERNLKVAERIPPVADGMRKRDELFQGAEKIQSFARSPLRKPIATAQSQQIRPQGF